MVFFPKKEEEEAGIRTFLLLLGTKFCQRKGSFLYSPASKLEASNSAGNLILQTFLEWVFFNYRSKQDYFRLLGSMQLLAQELRNSKIHFQYTCYHQMYRWWNVGSVSQLVRLFCLRRELAYLKERKQLK